MTLNIDLTDPAVQRQLGDTGKRRSVVQIAGDAPDPSGMSRLRGALSTTRLTGGKQEVVVVYKGMFLTVDVYQVPGEPLKVHLYCPRCHKHATVPGDRKAIDFEPAAPNPERTEIRASGQSELMDLADFGRLSIDTFECPWEIGDETHVQGAVSVGASLCRLRIAIDRNRVRDA
jgi:hypothetical protein